MEPSHRIDWFDGSVREDGPAPAPTPDPVTPDAEKSPRYERKLMGYRRLVELAGSEPGAVLLVLSGRTSFWHLLDSQLKPDFIVLIAKTLLGVCECNTEVSRSLLQRALSTRYLPALLLYLRSLPTTRISEKRLNMELWQDAEGALGAVLHLSSALCRLLPRAAGAVEVARALLDAAVAVRAGLVEQHSERFSNTLLQLESETAAQVAAAAALATPQNQESTAAHEGEAGEDYRRASVLPTTADVSGASAAKAPSSGARRWASAELYLREQFYLLREDYLAPLRRAIYEYRRHPSMENEHVRCVGVVAVVGRRVAGGRAGHMLALRTAAATLLHGSLLLLSTDNFRTLLAATVLDVVDAEHVCVSLHGEVWAECALVLEREYVALESVTYVEPYRRVLRALQHLQSDTLPFTPHLVHLRTEMSPPAYLNPDTEYALRECVGGEVRVRVLGSGPGADKWPWAARLGLDDSQAAAHRHALTTSLALIQGPPGTGKTHTGVRIVRTLLDNAVRPGAPLLVVCHTNRALDRFLQHLLLHTTDLVRLGTQSESEPLRPYTLSALRARARDDKHPAAAAHGAKLRQLEALVARTDALLRLLRAAGEGPLPYSALKPYLTIEGKHYPLDETDSRRDPVHVWLFAPLESHAPDASAPASWEEAEAEAAGNTALTLSPIEKDCFQREKAARGRLGASSQRWALYWRAADAVCAKWRADMTSLEEETARCARQLRELGTLLDAELCVRTRVLGATTTAAARHAPLLHALRTNIVLVEESAEVLETHVLAALSPHTQHLILIGDHRQLRPHTAEHASPLGVSLPERLLVGGVPSMCLREQRRMRPLLLTLICPLVYPDLVTHPAALRLPHVRGLLLDLFFFTHNNREVKRSSDYPLLEGVRMTTVDDFQGEESRIVILSLVRSNKDGDIGFLSTCNRVCVALSRAREGLYMLGDMSTLSARSALWQSVAGTLRQHADTIGDAITLQCHRHPNNLTAVSRAEQVAAESVHGGCSDACGARLACGHVCRAVCHAYDLQHRVFTCAEPCERRCTRGHTCPLECGAACEACSVRTQVTLACGHAAHVPCSLAQHTHMSCNTCSH